MKKTTPAAASLDDTIRELGLGLQERQPGEWTLEELMSGGMRRTATRDRMIALERQGKWSRRKLRGTTLWRKT